MQTLQFAMTAMDENNQSILYNFAQSVDELRRMKFPPALINPLINLVSISIFRETLAEARPVLLGFIGCTGAGKSTLFNSLAGQEISATGWKAHNTKGPILLSSEAFYQSVLRFEQVYGPLFLPGLKRHLQAPDPQNGTDEHQPGTAPPPGTFGDVESLQWVMGSAPDTHPQFMPMNLDHLGLIDLPDINTTKSRAESAAVDKRLIAMEILPWLDGVIFVVDEETLYHRDYEEPVQTAQALRQPRLCVLNNRGKDRIVLEHPDFQSVLRFFEVDDLFVLPEIESGSRFTNEHDFIRLKKALSGMAHAPTAPLRQNLQPLAQEFLRQNRRRRQAFAGLFERLETRLREGATTQRFAAKKNRDSAASQPPLAFHAIVHDDVIQVLQHLGLRRFALSNLWHFLRATKNTGNIKRSFALAFGSRRNETLEQVLRFDRGKYIEAARSRLNDWQEAIWTAMRRHHDYPFLSKLAPEIQQLTFELNNQHEEQLGAMLSEFENCCRELIQRDTLKTSIKNDPFTAVGLLVIMAADTLTLPGFGSWALVPTLTKYIPLGEFDRAKRRFQQTTADFIFQIAHENLQQLKTVQKDYCLDETHPAHQALTMMRFNNEKEHPTVFF